MSALDRFGGRPHWGSPVEDLAAAGGWVGIAIGGTLERYLGHLGPAHRHGAPVRGGRRVAHVDVGRRRGRRDRRARRLRHRSGITDWLRRTVERPPGPSAPSPPRRRRRSRPHSGRRQAPAHERAARVRRRDPHRRSRHSRPAPTTSAPRPTSTSEGPAGRGREEVTSRPSRSTAVPAGRRSPERRRQVDDPTPTATTVSTVAGDTAVQQRQATTWAAGTASTTNR